jgi:hypothetical protein
LTLQAKPGRFAQREHIATERRIDRCVHGCTKTPAPLLCEEHWPKVSAPVRRELVSLFKATQHQRKVPPRLVELLNIAAREALRDKLEP